MRALKRERELPVGRDEPRTPRHSLPSYDEPTPETHRRLTREDEAEIALTRTVFTSGTQNVLIALFLLTIVFVPTVQFVTELRARSHGVSLPMFGVLKAVTASVSSRRNESGWKFWRLLPHAEDLKAAEKTLESDSVVS